MLGAVTIDMDGMRLYHAIHGLSTPDGPDPLLHVAFPRFLDLCRHHGVRATVFVVGEDLAQPGFATLVARAHQDGHEIANHSHRHDYRLSQCTPAAIRADLWAAQAAIERVVGQKPVGFRAPGYNLSPDLLDAVGETGHAYDSSVLPSPGYFMARSLAISRYALKGRPSASLRGDARQFGGRRQPYRPSRGDILKPGHPSVGLWELPMAVVTPAGLPLVGTFLNLYPRALRRLLTRVRVASGGPLNLELHAMDFAQVEDGLDPALASHQPDLRVPLAQRLATLEEVVVCMCVHLEVLPLRGWLKRLNS